MKNYRNSSWTAVFQTIRSILPRSHDNRNWCLNLRYKGCNKVAKILIFLNNLTNILQTVSNRFATLRTCSFILIGRVNPQTNAETGTVTVVTLVVVQVEINNALVFLVQMFRYYSFSKSRSHLSVWKLGLNFWSVLGWSSQRVVYKN